MKVGTLAGNLMIKHQHNEFQSDLFTILETFGAQLNILDAPNSSKKMSVAEFLQFDMKKKVILNISLPMLLDKSRFKFSYFKVFCKYDPWQTVAIIMLQSF